MDRREMLKGVVTSGGVVAVTPSVFALVEDALHGRVPTLRLVPEPYDPVAAPSGGTHGVSAVAAMSSGQFGEQPKALWKSFFAAYATERLRNALLSQENKARTVHAEANWSRNIAAAPGERSLTLWVSVRTKGENPRRAWLLRKFLPDYEQLIQLSQSELNDAIDRVAATALWALADMQFDDEWEFCKLPKPYDPVAVLEAMRERGFECWISMNDLGADWCANWEIGKQVAPRGETLPLYKQELFPDFPSAVQWLHRQAAAADPEFAEKWPVPE